MGVPSSSRASREHSRNRIGPKVEWVEGRLLLSTVLTQFGRVNETSDFAVLDDAAYFFTYDAGTKGSDAATLWRTDGTADGTRVVMSGFKFIEHSVQRPGSLTAADGRLYFSAWDADHGIEPWVSDGTPEGTFLLKDTNPGPYPSPVGWAPGAFTVFDGRVYFAGGAAGGLDAVWSTDGTPEGTHEVGEPFAVVYTSAGGLTRSGDHLLFHAAVTSGVAQLWRTDGTDAGTTLIKALPGPPFASVTPPVDVNGTAFFFAPASETADSELWKTDGTPEGTVLVKDIYPGDHASTDGRPGAVAVNGRLYFKAADSGSETGGSSYGLWASDGTTEGTVEVLDEAPGASLGLNPTNIVPWDGDIVFSGYAGSAGAALWRSDGTTAGTTMLSDVHPSGIKAGPDGLYFMGQDAEHGYELWKTDGTAGGTVLVEDINPGPASSLPKQYVFLGNTVLVITGDASVGYKLLRLDGPGGTPATVVGRHVFYNNSAFDGGDGAPNAADDGAIAVDKDALPAGSDRVPGFDNVTSYAKGLNGVMVDVAGLPPDQTLTAADFEFRSGPDLSNLSSGPSFVQVSVRRGAGALGSDRVTITWSDYNPNALPLVPVAVANGWLSVTVKANVQTGLAQPDVFSFGNLIGETGDGGGAAGWRVSALDLGIVKKALNSAAAITAPADANRDGRVNALDLGVLKRNLNRGLAVPPSAPVLGKEDVARVADAIL